MPYRYRMHTTTSIAALYYQQPCYDILNQVHFQLNILLSFYPINIYINNRKKNGTDPFTFIVIDPVCVYVGEVRSFFLSKLPWTNRQPAAAAVVSLNVINLGGETFVRLLVLYRNRSFLCIVRSILFRYFSNSYTKKSIKKRKLFDWINLIYLDLRKKSNR